VLPAGQRLCEAKTEAGLGYTMLRPAAGPMPAEADYVLVNYIGYLAATGAVFDQGKAAKFPVNGVIPGFSKGLQMLGKGGIARFCIPAAMGYGAQGRARFRQFRSGLPGRAGRLQDRRRDRHHAQGL
jgi:FKBP-type peptidyl-prolyl cis-trans isomerase FkpA